MRKLFLLSTLLICFILAYAKGGGGGHASSGHTSSHASESSVHEATSESPVHETETSSTHVSEDEFHQTQHNNVPAYYYLMMNHQTNHTDTIWADSRDALSKKVNAGDIDNISSNIGSIFILILIIAGLIYLCYKAMS